MQSMKQEYSGNNILIIKIAFLTSVLSVNPNCSPSISGLIVLLAVFITILMVVFSYVVHYVDCPTSLHPFLLVVL